MKKLSKNQSKRGAASLYVVIFTTLLFGVITMSFVRLIISEATQTTNSDLSQSAYDSALAGVEDAKIALIKYHDCLSQGYAGVKDSLTDCEKTIYEMQYGIANDSCDSVSKSLSRTQESDGSIIIQETKDPTKDGAAEMLQAYTCVKIAEELPDYRTTLNSDTRLRIIPLRTDKINDLAGIGIKWYSDQNKAATFNWDGLSKATAGVPPVISVQILQADKEFRLSQLSASSSIGTDRGTVFLSPHETKTDLPIISDDDNRKGEWGFSHFVPESTMRSTSDKAPNQLYDVTCKNADSTAEWLCSTFIEMPRTYEGGNRNQGATFAIVTLPYGSPATDISLQMFKKNRTNNYDVIQFSGVQARVDSTGRANDLYRRVETRVELVDLNYPYPEFAKRATRLLYPATV